MSIKKKEYFKKPFIYDDYGQMVFDADNNIVVEVRGWGHLENVTDSETAERVQQSIGKRIAKMLNNEWNFKE